MRDLTLIRKNLMRRKLRFFLLFISIAIAFFLYGALNTVHNALQFASSNAQDDRYIVASKVNFTQPLPIAYTDEVRRMRGVASAAPSAWFGGYYREPRNFVVSYAVELSSYLAVYSEYVLPAEQRRSCIARRDGLLVGRALADQYGWSVGQTVTLMSSIYTQSGGERSWPFTICGIFTDARSQGTDIGAFMHYDYFNGSRVIGRDTINFVTLRVQPGVDAAAIQDAIDARFANSAFETETTSEQQFSAVLARQFGNIGLIVAFVVGAALISMAVIVGSSMLLAIRERTRELAILKTLGFPRRRLLKIVAGESLLIMLVGGLFGLGAAQLLTLLVSQLPALAAFAMQPMTWLSGIAWILVLAVLIAVAPVYHAMNVNVLTGLGRR